MRQLFVVAAALFVFTACATGRGTTPSTEASAARQDSGNLLTRQEISGLSQADAQIALAQLQEEEAQNRKDALEDFKTGAGLGISVVIGDSQDVIDDAAVVDKKIVVTRRAKDQPRAALEAHQLFTANPLTAPGRQAIRQQIQDCATNPINCPLMGVGPFAAIQTAADNSISSAGFGLMLGVRADPRKGSSFNIGVGIVFDRGVKELASGFVEGKDLPPGESQVRFTERSARRLMVTLSFAF